YRCWIRRSRRSGSIGRLCRTQSKIQNPKSKIRTGRFRRLQGPTAGEDGEAAQQGGLFLRQSIVAPVDESAQRLVARQGPPPAAGRRGEASAQPGRDLRDRQYHPPGRRELEGERDAVQPPADPRYSQSFVPVAELIAGPHRRRPLHQELRRWELEHEF